MGRDWNAERRHAGDARVKQSRQRPRVSVMECSDGKIRHDVDYWDMATVMRQLGLLPAAAKGGQVKPAH